jgi:hypothetical protein
MARPLRPEISGGIYYLEARGAAGRDVFPGPGDREVFLSLLGDIARQEGWRVHGWCLLASSYLLVVETPSGRLSHGMRQLGGIYTQHINREHPGTGPLFRGRYRSVLVERGQALVELLAWMALRPQIDGLIRQTKSWQWSFLPALMGEVKAPDWQETRWCLSQFGQTDGAARLGLTAFLNGKRRDLKRGGAAAVNPLRRVRGQIFLGSPEFIEQSRAFIRQGRDFAEQPRNHVLPERQPLSSYAEQAGTRNAAMAAAYHSKHYTQAEIAAFFGVHYATVSRAIKQMRSPQGNTPRRRGRRRKTTRESETAGA